METYCVKCKAKTPCEDMHVVNDKNGRHRLVANCTRCHIKKSCYISPAVVKELHGKGLISNIVGLFSPAAKEKIQSVTGNIALVNMLI